MNKEPRSGCFGCLAMLLVLPVLFVMCTGPSGNNPDNSSVVAHKNVGKKNSNTNHPAHKIDEALARALSPACEDYIREHWQGQYVLYDDGRYKWDIANIAKAPKCTTTNCYLVDVTVSFTDHVGHSDGPYFSKVAIAETNGNYQITDKFAWCFWIDGQKFCK